MVKILYILDMGSISLLRLKLNFLTLPGKNGLNIKTVRPLDQLEKKIFTDI